MKKCPYCAERIQDEAIVCRFCGRELFANVEELVKSGMQSRTKISSDTIMNLGRIYAKTYPSKALVEEIQRLVFETIKTLFNPIFGKYLEHELTSEKSIQKETMRINGMMLLWGFVCCGIGIEHGLDNLEMGEAYNCLIAISKPCSLFILDYLSGLFEKGLIKQEEVDLEFIFIYKTVLQTGIQIHEHGRKKCESASRRNADFLKAIHGLDISSD